MNLFKNTEIEDVAKYQELFISILSFVKFLNKWSNWYKPTLREKRNKTLSINILRILASPTFFGHT